MDRRSHLLNLAQGLSKAAAEGNWEALAEADGLVASRLPQLAARGPWTSGERAALEELRRAHREACEQCAREAGRMQEKMDEMNASRTGWRAYAENGDLEGSRA